MKRIIVIGRFQPFHKGHKHVIDQAKRRGEVIIGIKNAKLNEDTDPWTIEQRIKMIKTVYPEEEVVVIPDFDEVWVGRKVGYKVINKDITSGTYVRDRFNKGEDISKEIPYDIELLK